VDGVPPATGHGLFPHHLLAGLSGAADRDADGELSLGELSAYVTQAVEADARLENREQTPTLSAEDPAAAGGTVLVRGLR
jgi:hypothetical protein